MKVLVKRFVNPKSFLSFWDFLNLLGLKKMFCHSKTLIHWHLKCTTATWIYLARNLRVEKTYFLKKNKSQKFSVVDLDRF